MYQTAISILKKLSSVGYQGYIIGGYVRDCILKISSSDIDLCTDATPDVIKNYFQIVQDFSQFGCMVIQENNFEFEITTFRKDSYKNSRYPKIVYVKTLEEDLKRRDFTINTFCIDQNEKLIDLLNAKEDIERRVIRSIGNPTLKLKEDPIRILRAIRLSCQLNLDIDSDLSNAILNSRKELIRVSRKNLEKEYFKILKFKEGKKILQIYQIDCLLSDIFHDTNN